MTKLYHGDLYNISAIIEHEATVLFFVTVSQSKLMVSKHGIDATRTCPALLDLRISVQIDEAEFQLTSTLFRYFLDSVLPYCLFQLGGKLS